MPHRAQGADQSHGARVPVVIIGAGGHAKVTIEVLREQGLYEPHCCLDSSGIKDVLGIPVVGGDELLPDLLVKGCRHAFVAIGNNRVRERICDSLLAQGFELPAAIHPNAIVSRTACIGRGVLLMPGVIVNADARIEDFAIVNTNAVVEHDCIVGRAAHIAPGVILAGNVHVGARTFLGAGVIARPGTRIGDDVVAGSGAVIVSPVTAGTVVGIPARPLKARILEG